MCLVRKNRNNVVIDRETSPGWGAISIGSVNNATTERRPGYHHHMISCQ